LTIAGAAAMATVAMSSAAFADNTETVVVTGSRIPVSSNLTSVSPIQSVTDQQFKIKGATDVSDMLNDMPQTFISSKSDFANANNPLTSPGGITTVNLRGLGPTRTLVLVNGRRLGIGDPNTGNPNAAPDIDQIPVALLQRVEVLTGGASSTYGSDAVAGVVNFIMKQDFEGVQIDAQYGVNWHDNTNSFARNLQQKAIDSGIQGPQSLAPDSVLDGRNIETSIMMGSNTADGKGNVTGYFSYRSADPVWMRNRDYSACQINIKSSAGCAGSANSNYFQPTVGRDPVTGALGQMLGGEYSIVGHSAQDWGTGASNPPAMFNSNAFETLSRQDTRFSGGFFGHYDISKYAKPYTEFQFMDDKSFQQIAPSAMFNGSNAFSADGSGNYYVNCDNPLMSADQVNKFCTSQNLLPSDYTELAVGRRNIEGGGRTSDYEHQSFRGVVGVKGDITDNWHYDAFGSYYYVTVDQNNGNYLSNQKVNKAIDVITGPALLSDGKTPNPFAGQPECRSVYQNLDTACVPYNIFTEGGINKAQTDYLATYGTSRGTLYEHVLEIDITGDLTPYGVKSPFANDGVQVSFGASNRKDHMTYAGDVAESSNDLMGFGGATVPINNGVTVTEEYGEIRIPLAQNLPFVQDLSMDAGIRFSAYSNHRRPTTWKLGLQWTPLDDIRFRASYDVAIRAPSILETYTPESVTNTSDVSSDPCAPTNDDSGKHAAAATLAQCLRTGVTAAQYGDGLNTSQIIQCPSNQCATLTGGNTNLSPEKAKTFSVGMTVTPSLVPGLSASFDYYKIDVYNVIGTIPLETSLNNCLTNGTLCNNVRRTSSGTLFGTTINGGGYIIGNDMNIAFQNVSGIDIQSDYLTSLADIGLPDYGSLGFHLTGTYAVTSKNRSLDGEPMYDCTGLFGNTCGSPMPRWRHHFRINWDTPWDLGLALTWRYFSGAQNEKNSTQPVVSGTPDKLNSHLHDMSYLDLAVSYQVTKELELRAGMNNVFDFDPQIISNTITGSGSPNTYNSYDMLGRTMYVALTAKL
jgi:outer membrane cobalamin receptor